MRVFKLIDSAIDVFARYALFVLIISMLTLSFLTIVFRWFQITYMWMEPLTRHLVFLAAFLGGVLAAGRGSHISIDLMAKFLEVRGMFRVREILMRVISFIAFGALCWLFKAGFALWRLEVEFGKERFLGIQSSHLIAIIPFGLGLIAYRFFYKAIGPSESGEKGAGHA